jgi:hypothetical protein
MKKRGSYSCIKNFEEAILKIRITIGDLRVEAELFDTECAKGIYDLLPLESRVNEWGDEFYFKIPKKMPLDETATEDVDIGDIGYWPPGTALCIFFGPTPISEGEKPRPVSKVNVVGKVIGEPRILKMAKGSKKVTLEKI